MKKTILLLFSVFLLLTYTDVSAESLPFTKYDDLIEYTEDTDTQTVYYKYKTNTVGQLNDNNWNENITKRQSDKEFYYNPTTNQTKVKIYSGDNYIRQANDWFQLEYATTTETNFFDELEKTVEPENLFDKMISLFDFFPASADSSNVYSSWDGYCYYNGPDGTTWQTAHDASACTEMGLTGTLLTIRAQYYDANNEFFINRGMLSFDTQFLATSTVESASLFIYIATVLDEDNDGKDYISTVGFTPASSTLFVLDDYDQVGDAIDNPTKTSAEYDMTSISTAQYLEMVLNATGIGQIDKNGWTEIGIREGHDQEDEAIESGGGTIRNKVDAYSMEQTGTANDPYLEIVYSFATSSPPEATTTPVTVASLPCDFRYSIDLSMITGCTEIYSGTSASSTVLTETRYSYYHIPFLVFVVFACLFFFIFGRIILELIIRLRK